MMPETATEIRDRLRSDASSAAARVERASAAFRGEWHLTEELLAPLWSKRIQPHRPPEFLEDFSKRLLEEVCERRLAFDLAGAERALVIFDPEVRKEERAAREAKALADRRLRNFESTHGEALAAEARRAEAERIRASLRGDDPDAIRRAIQGEPEPARAGVPA